MESFQTPFIVCLRTESLQEQDEPAPLELLGALERIPDAETEQEPIITPPTLCPRLKHQPPILIDLSQVFAHRHHNIARICCSSHCFLAIHFLYFNCYKLKRPCISKLCFWYQFIKSYFNSLSLQTKNQKDTQMGLTTAVASGCMLWIMKDKEKLSGGLWSYQSTLRDRLL